MKRKLPQWLLDVTNHKDKIVKPNTPQSNQSFNNNNTSNTENNQSDLHSNSVDAQSVNVGTIAVVPLANLMSPSREGVQTNQSNTSDVMDTGSTTVIQPTATTINGVPLPVQIKTEKVDSVDASGPSATSDPQIVVKTEIKDEPVDTATSSAANVPPTVAPKVVNVKPERRSCNYGIKCFRRNPDHRTELAHPGDADYRRPDLPSAPVGTPPCPWGAACYRRNPQHFLQLSHPPARNTTPVSTTAIPPQPNPPLNQRRQRNTTTSRSRIRDNDDSDAEDDYDLEDPFINDGSSDEYVPKDGEDSDDDDDDDLEELGDN